MSIQRIPPRLTPTNWSRAIARGLAAAAATLGLLILAGCGEPSEAGGGATLSGTVRADGSGTPVADASIKLGTRQATSDANGRFELTEVPTGAATVRAERPGYQRVDETLKVLPDGAERRRGAA